MLGEGKADVSCQPGAQLVSQKEISHSSENLSEYLTRKTGTETEMGQW